MSNEACAAVWKHSMAAGDARLVLLAIADQAKQNGTGAWPSVRRLAEMSRLTDRSVQRILRKLEEMGELRVHVGAGPHGTNLYDVLLPGLHQSAATSSKATGDRKSPPLTESRGDIKSPPPTQSQVTESRGDILSGDSRPLQGVTPVSPDPRTDPKDHTHTPRAREAGELPLEPEPLRRRALTGSGVMAGTLPRDHARCHQPCIGRVCLHESQFANFVRMWPGNDDDQKRAAVNAWVAEVHEVWTSGDRRDDVPQGNAFDFWRERWDERWPKKASPPAATSRAESIRRAVVEREVGELLPWVHECRAHHGGQCRSSSAHAELMKRPAVPA